MEMLVTVAILALMVGAFGAILTEAQDLVVTSQAIMKANARATSLAGIIREDISRASRLGFLHIEHDTANGERADRLYIGVPGACKSVVSWETGTGAIIAVGRKGSTASDGNLFRGRWILANKAGGTNPPNDMFLGAGSYSPDYTDIQTADEDQFNGDDDDGGKTDFVDRMQTLTDNMPLNPSSVTDLDEINELWPLLARNCKVLTIEALEVVSGELQPWDNSSNSDLDFDGTGTWTKSGFLQWKLGDAKHPDKSDWPKAIKITMTLTDPEILDRADETSTFTYEIICPVRP